MNKPMMRSGTIQTIRQIVIAWLELKSMYRLVFTHTHSSGSTPSTGSSQISRGSGNDHMAIREDTATGAITIAWSIYNLVCVKFGSTQSSIRRKKSR